MVGIYNKIKNGLNWLKGKALKYVAPAIGKLGDLASNELLNGVVGVATPFLNTIAPGLGTGIGKGLDWLGNAGTIANGVAADYAEQGDKLGFGDIYTNIKSGKYNKKRSVPKGIDLAERPEKLHERIELKMLPAPDDYDGETASASFVEEVD
jgi:hypothetical protein